MLKLPASKFNDAEIRYIKGEYPKKYRDKIKVSNLDPISYFFGLALLSYGLIVAIYSNDFGFGIAIEVAGSLFVIASLLVSTRNSCILSNYRMMYQSELLEFEDEEEEADPNA